MAHKRDLIKKYADLRDAISHIHDYDIDPIKNEMYLVGREEYVYSVDTDDLHNEPGVDFTMANRAIRNLRILQSISKDPIIIHMKTCGGDFLEGMAIHDAIRACPNHVTIINYGAARSMSSIFFQAAEQRLMMPHSWFMMHEGTTGDGAVTEKQKRSWDDFEKRWGKAQMFDIYAKVMGAAPRWSDKSKKQIKNWLVKQMNDFEEVYLTPEETVEHGLADGIFDYDWSSLRDE